MFKKIFIVVIAVLWYGSAFAAHPLITDDAGTQGNISLRLMENMEMRNMVLTVKKTLPR